MTRAGVALVALLLAGCAGGGAGASSSTSPTPSPTPSLTTVTGSMSVTGTVPADAPTVCIQSEGYNDLDNAQVVLSTDAGATLDTTSLDPQPVAGPTDEVYQCTFTFTFKPLELKPTAYYQVEVGRRGKLRYTGEQLTRPLELTLG